MKNSGLDSKLQARMSTRRGKYKSRNSNTKLVVGMIKSNVLITGYISSSLLDVLKIILSRLKSKIKGFFVTFWPKKLTNED